MTNPYRAMCAELIERLGWFIAEDETNENDPGNQYWLTGKQAGIDSVDRARALLAHPTTQPVAVSERLPGPEDCNEQGRCWMFGNVEGDWRLISTINPGIPKLKYCFSHWLPANALPTPEATND
jgi:hypothetical protein